MKLNIINPLGVHQTEEKALRILEKELPKEWVGYAGFLLPDGQSRSMEIDLLIFAKDRLILVELKHWAGEIEMDGKDWLQHKRESTINHPSPVDINREKALRIKKFFRKELESQWGCYYDVSHYVVLSGSATIVKSNPLESPFVTTIDQFQRVGRKNQYGKFFDISKSAWAERNPEKRPCAPKQVSIFNKWRRGGDRLVKKCREEAGYIIGDNVPIFIGGRESYAEYKAEHHRYPDDKSLIRIWNFNSISDIAASSELRAYYGLREDRVHRYVKINNRQLSQDYLLEPKHNLSAEEVPHDLAEVYALPPKIVRLDEYLQSVTLSKDERITMIRSILTPMAAMHALGVSHRDLSLQRLWFDPTRGLVLLSGLNMAQFPDEGGKSIAERRLDLASNKINMPEDLFGENSVNSQSMDVFQLAVIIYHVAFNEYLDAEDFPQWTIPKNDPFDGRLSPIIEKALSIEAADRYQDANEMIKAMTQTFNQKTTLGADEFNQIKAELSEFYDQVVPFQSFPMTGEMTSNAMTGALSYPSIDESGNMVRVKNFPTLTQQLSDRGTAQRLLNFFNRCRVIKANVVPCAKLYHFGCGLSGTYTVQKYVDGIDLETWINDNQEANLERRVGLSKALIKAVNHLHDLQIDHGDLKPANIVVEEGAAGEFKVTFIDLLDMNQQGFKPKTPDYQPKIEAGPESADRYAAYLIVDEIFQSCRDDRARVIKDEIVQALAQEEKAPGNLKDLKRALDIAAEPLKEELPPFTIKSAYLRVDRAKLEKKQTVELEANAGSYHISAVVNTVNETIRCIITALSYKVTLVADLPINNQLKVNKIFVDKLSAGDFISNNRNNGTTESFENPIVLMGSEETNHTEMSEFLLSLDSVQNALDIALKSQANKQALEPKVATGELNIPALWKKHIEVEKEILPEVVALNDAEKRNGTVVVEVKENLDNFDFEQGDTVNINVADTDAFIGELDIVESSNGLLVFSHDQRSNDYKINNIKQGTRLTLENSGNAVSWRRRDAALQRVMDGAAVMPDLVDAFTSGLEGDQPPSFKQPTDEELSRYNLDDSKIKAFKYALGQSVSVLVGPPGSGKTKVSASILEYLVSSTDIRRILIVSQSNIAADEVSVRFREMIAQRESELGKSLNASIVRLGDENKIADDMLDVHSHKLQEQARTAFYRDLEIRLMELSNRMAVPSSFVLDAAMLYKRVGTELFDYATISRSLKDIATDLEAFPVENNAHGKVRLEERLRRLTRRKEQMENGLLGRLSNFTEFPNDLIKSETPLYDLLTIIGAKHGVVGPHLIKRVASVLEISHHWYKRLATDGDGYASFAAKTRQVIVGTLVGVGRHLYNLDRSAFDLVLIDEAGRATFSELAIAMQCAKRIMLVGDHKQLKATYSPQQIREVCRQLGISKEDAIRSDFERAFHVNNGVMLDTQYRMAPPIGDMISHCFYDNKLSTGRGFAPEWMQSLPTPWNKTVSWVDTSSINSREENLGKGKGIANTVEVDLICGLLKSLIKNPESIEKLREWDKTDSTLPIGVITGYRKQVKLLQSKLDSAPWASSIRDMIKIDSVDSYQGSENRIILLSLVRNNESNISGFMNDDARVNVALSRAKERLIIVGAGDMWSSRDSKIPLSRVYQYLNTKQAQVSEITREQQIINVGDLIETPNKVEVG
ncbi:AAA domain-containing protein [Vibrio owensii]|uniref:AAA domain-containing protein n=1 Tax=Vibrio owensii TaxID=696485 RepID=UPI003AAFBB63|nr:NERD domain-containing protein [Vibrio parahaemolyticus]